jgi:hypothetical protein
MDEQVLLSIYAPQLGMQIMHSESDRGDRRLPPLGWQTSATHLPSRVLQLRVRPAVAASGGTGSSLL